MYHCFANVPCILHPCFLVDGIAWPQPLDAARVLSQLQLWLCKLPGWILDWACRLHPPSLNLLWCLRTSSTIHMHPSQVQTGTCTRSTLLFGLAGGLQSFLCSGRAGDCSGRGRVKCCPAQCSHSSRRYLRLALARARLWGLLLHTQPSKLASLPCCLGWCVVW